MVDIWYEDNFGVTNGNIFVVFDEANKNQLKQVKWFVCCFIYVLLVVSLNGKLNPDELFQKYRQCSVTRCDGHLADPAVSRQVPFSHGREAQGPGLLRHPGRGREVPTLHLYYYYLHNLHCISTYLYIYLYLYLGATAPGSTLSSTTTTSSVSTARAGTASSGTGVKQIWRFSYLLWISRTKIW